MSGVVLSAWSEVTLIPNLLTVIFIKLFLPPYIFGPHNELVREQAKYYTPFINGEIKVQSN